MTPSNQHLRDFEIVQAYIAYRGGLPEDAGAALRRIEEQFEAAVAQIRLEHAWKADKANSPCVCPWCASNPASGSDDA